MYELRNKYFKFYVFELFWILLKISKEESIGFLKVLSQIQDATPKKDDSPLIIFL